MYVYNDTHQNDILHNPAAVEAYFRPIFIAIQNVASVGRFFLPLSDSGKSSLAL